MAIWTHEGAGNWTVRRAAQEFAATYWAEPRKAVRVHVDTESTMVLPPVRFRISGGNGTEYLCYYVPADYGRGGYFAVDRIGG